MVTNTETKFSATKAASFLGISKHTVLRRWRSGELQPDEVTASGRPIWLLPTLERYRARGAEKTAEILFLGPNSFPYPGSSAPSPKKLQQPPVVLVPLTEVIPTKMLAEAIGLLHDLKPSALWASIAAVGCLEFEVLRMACLEVDVRMVLF